MSEPRPPILEEGVTCWRIAPAGRVAVLIDGADYFAALLRALREARSRILIVGWDFDPRIRLDPSDPATELRRLLRALVEERPRLHVHLLIWDISIVFGPSRAVDQLLATGWQEHPRIGFCFDNRHPVGGAQHEKIVCIDDALAFVGGIDLTVERWDTQRHAFEPDARRGPGGATYDPVHDLQLLVDGEAARGVAELMRRRWAKATGEDLAPCDGQRELWPDPLVPAFAKVPVGIARTRPAVAGRAAVRGRRPQRRRPRRRPPLGLHRDPVPRRVQRRRPAGAAAGAAGRAGGRDPRLAPGDRLARALRHGQQP